MIQEMKMERYRGVLCRNCRQPIPLPAIVISLENAADKDPRQENPARAFHLRCRACEYENTYRSTDIADFDGTPRPRISLGRSAYTRSRQTSGLSKAANA